MVRKEEGISLRKMLIAFETVIHVVQINSFIKARDEKEQKISFHLRDLKF